MRAIRSTDTKPELAVRRTLHSLGFRYRLHRRDLPGTPDIVLPRWRAIIQVNGCYFHGHTCRVARLPSTNREYWEEKIRRNRERDVATAKALRAEGWRVMTVWECALRGPLKVSPEALGKAVTAFVQGDRSAATLRGRRRPKM